MMIKISLEPYLIKSTCNIETKVNLNEFYLQVSYIFNRSFFHKVDTMQMTSFKKEHELWNGDCLEFFLANKNSDIYYEVNISPTSNSWNCYRLDSYRSGLEQSNELELIDKAVTQSNSQIELVYTFRITNKLQKFLKEEGALMNITCVQLNREKRDHSFWAITHPENKADFHLKEFYKEFKNISTGV